MRSKRIFFQKIYKIKYKIIGLIKDVLIRNLLKTYNIKYGILIYDLITYSPIENAIILICGKFCLNKIIVLIIIALLL